MTLTVLCGLPAAGKSTLAKTLAGKILTADSIRLTGASASTVFAALHARLASALGAGRDVVLDTCALQSDERERYLLAGRAANARCNLIVLDTPIAACKRRDSLRPVGERAGIDWGRAQRLLAESMRVLKHEGWDSVRIVR